MALTPETLVRHELTGLRVRVVEATNPDLVGIEGRVVLETTNTLHVECVPSKTERRRDGRSSAPAVADADDQQDDDPRVKQVPKVGAVFEFALTDDAADAAKASGSTSKRDGSRDGVAHVTVDGTRLLSRPARRTEQRGISPWR